jgi:O-methyltransferase
VDRGEEVMLYPLHVPVIEEWVKNKTMCTPEDIACMLSAVQHIHVSHIRGVIVECGVWEGGMLKAAQHYMEMFDFKRDVWAYDTFTGMTEPDQSVDGATSTLEAGTLAVDLERVKAYLGDEVTYVVGDVRETVWQKAPEEIAVLRLDTDWYENTKVTLEALFPRLSPGGVLLVDDYRFWTGCKKAVEEYFGDAMAKFGWAGNGIGMVK